MNIMKWLLVGSLLLITIQISYAQPPQHKKWQKAIDALERADFVKEYHRLKDKIESQVAVFHTHKHTIALEDFELVQKHYEATLEDFDIMLNDLKNDFKTKANREAMVRRPDKYTEDFKDDLNKIRISYNTNCASLIEALTESDSGAIGITEITAVIALVGELVKIVDKWQKKVEEMSGAYLEENFIRDLRLKKWDHY